MPSSKVMQSSALLALIVAMVSFHRDQKPFSANTVERIIRGELEDSHRGQLDSQFSDLHLRIEQRPWLFGLPVNVNHSNARALKDIPGIGPRLSERIINHRNTKGQFKNESDLDGVKGIGPGILRKIRHHICF